ncbi:MAG: hypothetical protein ABIV36_05220 [Sphingobium limneticum]
MVIPRLPGERQGCAAQIGAHEKVHHDVNGRLVTFIVEQTNGGCAHASTVADLTFMLSHIPPADWAGLKTFVFRQPTRKARMLNPVWGRLYYEADIAFSGTNTVLSGPTLFLEAVEAGSIMKWSTSLDREDSEELDRLRSDGHAVSRTGRNYLISTSLESLRTTQLYRTLLHEIGHWFDWLSKVETPAARGEDIGDLIDLYFARPRSEREAFAHRYADTLRHSLSDNGLIPFERIER